MILDTASLGEVFKDALGEETKPINAGTYTVNITGYEFNNEENASNYDIKYLHESKEFTISRRKVIVSIKEFESVV